MCQIQFAASGTGRVQTSERESIFSPQTFFVGISQSPVLQNMFRSNLPDNGAQRDTMYPNPILPSTKNLYLFSSPSAEVPSHVLRIEEELQSKTFQKSYFRATTLHQMGQQATLWIKVWHGEDGPDR